MSRGREASKPTSVLEIPRDHWRSRWLVLPTWNRLHRIAEIEWGGHQYGEPDEMLDGDGRAVCGATGYFVMPGIFSRMGLPRCAHCCDAIGVPRGNGCPENEGIDT